MYNNLAKELMNFLDWQPTEYLYNRPTLDSKPYQIVREKDNSKATIFFNAVGISKENIKIEISRERGIDFLNISGEEKNAMLGKTYSVNGKFSLDSETVKDIEWSAKDGILSIAVRFKEAERSKIKITAKQ